MSAIKAENGALVLQFNVLLQRGHSLVDLSGQGRIEKRSVPVTLNVIDDAVMRQAKTQR